MYVMNLACSYQRCLLVVQNQLKYLHDSLWVEFLLSVKVYITYYYNPISGSYNVLYFEFRNISNFLQLYLKFEYLNCS